MSCVVDRLTTGLEVIARSNLVLSLSKDGTRGQAAVPPKENKPEVGRLTMGSGVQPVFTADMQLGAHERKPYKVWRPGAWIAALVLGVGVAMTADASGAERLEGPTWLAEDIKGGGVIDNAQSTVSIAAGGKVTGSGGCNRMFGTATIAGDALTFGGIGTTRMACAPALDGSGAEVPGRARRHAHASGSTGRI